MVVAKYCCMDLCTYIEIFVSSFRSFLSRGPRAVDKAVVCPFFEPKLLFLFVSHRVCCGSKSNNHGVGKIIDVAQAASNTYSNVLCLLEFV